MRTPVEEWLRARLEGLAAEHRLRERELPPTRSGPYRVGSDGARLLDLCSNDYLGLGAMPAAEGEAGAGASRLVSGDLDVHPALDAHLADWLGAERALLFSSGYAANVGAVQALAGSGSAVVVSDERNHASLVDGCRLSRARIVVTPHLDVPSVRRALESASEANRWVVTDAYFSMDGHLAPLQELRAVCDEFGAGLLVDEAHALGVLGPGGRGVSAAAGIRPDVLVGTLGKAFGAGGAFVLGSEALHNWLWNTARSFVFSTGLAPVVAATAHRNLAFVRTGERTRAVMERSALLRSLLAEAGVEVPGVGPILPLLVGSEARALDASAFLRGEGFHVKPIRPPTVAPNACRLRVTVRADLPEDALPAAAAAIARAVRR